MTSPPTPAPRRRFIAPLAIVGIALVLLVGLLLGRMWLARTALTNWLGARGVESDVQLERFGPGDLQGQFSVGPKDAPDFSAEDIIVRYRVADWRFWRPGGFQVSSVELIRPVLRARLTMAGRVSFGSLDPIVDDVLSRPSQPDAPKPLIILRQATIHLDTPYGRGIALGDARIEDGRVRSLSARVSPGVFTAGASRAELRALRIEVRSTGDQASANIAGEFDRLASPDASAEGLRMTLAAQGPYPDLDRKRVDGGLRASLNSAAQRVSWTGGAALAPRAAVTYAGRIAGWGQTLRLLGAGKAQFLAEAANQGDITLTSADVRIDAPDLDIAPVQRRAAAQTLALDLGLARLATPSAALRAVRGRFAGRASLAGSAGDAALVGDLAARGGYSGLGPAQGSELAVLTQTRRALSDFAIRAPGLSLSTEGGGRISLTAPVHLQSPSGARVTIAALRGAPLYAQGAGAGQIAVRGGGLPTVDARILRYRLAGGRLEAQADLEARGDLAPASGVVLAAEGSVRVSGGTTQITLARCGALSIDAIDLGENDVTDVTGQICPADEALISLSRGAFRSQARLAQTKADLASLNLRVSDGEGEIRASGGKTASADLDLASLRVIDTGRARRFEPANASGVVRLAGDSVSADLAIASAQGVKVANLALAHALSTGMGSAQVDTGDLVFADEGLQPADISPLAAVIDSPVSGQARFKGSFEWGRQTLTSRGDLTVNRLDFKSPVGDVRGLSGTVGLTGLSPMTAPPGQVLTIDSIDGPLPVTGARASFGLADEQLQIETASASVGGGSVSVGATNVPFDQTQTWEAVLLVSGVQLSDIIEKTAFADKFSLSAKVTGRAPLTIGPEGVRVLQGQFAAIEAGRMSLKREVLTEVSAGGGPDVPGAPPNLAADFAYQAMENLSFESLSLEMNSLPAGRLGLLFKVKGEHTPPNPQELRLTITELLRQTFLNRALLLPSGTGVDLTLDASLNADELLSDVVNLRGGSQSVQPVQ